MLQYINFPQLLVFIVYLIIKITVSDMKTDIENVLILSKIWGFHGGDYEECRLLGCYAVWLL
jgi:hypothetical protein